MMLNSSDVQNNKLYKQKNSSANKLPNLKVLKSNTIQNNQPPDKRPFSTEMVREHSATRKEENILGNSITSKPIKVDKNLANEDERQKQLLKHGNIKRIDEQDKVIFAELPQIPGILVVQRKQSERNFNPERLNLDRKDLTHMPLLEGEEKLRLLCYQHNRIEKIENLVSLPNLIFLDLQDNEIKEIASLHTVPTLRVLMLGKNKIEKIRNLNTNTKLDVLDLHSNRITRVENLGHLKDLRVLNIANNQIAKIEGLKGLTALTELNLRRNLINSVSDETRHVKNLLRLFLSNNHIDSFSELNHLKQCTNLSELSLEHNPVFQKEEQALTMLQLLPALKILDMKKVTEEAKKVDSDKDSKSSVPSKKEDEVGISADNLFKVISREWISEIRKLRMKSTLFQVKKKRESVFDCKVQSGHAEIEGDNLLFIYGNALEVLNNEGFQASVEQILFQQVRFDQVVHHSWLSKLKKFRKVRKLIFSQNNLSSLIHLSKLENIPTLSNLVIEHNDVAKMGIFMSFVVQRFPQISQLNDLEITDQDRRRARTQFLNFDKVLSNQSTFTFKIQYDPKKDTDPKHKDKPLKRNLEYASSQVSNITQVCKDKLDSQYNLSNSVSNILHEYIDESLKEFGNSSIINDDMIKI